MARKNHRLDELLKFTKRYCGENPGSIAELSRHLKKPPVRIHEWFNRHYWPNGENTLGIIDWLKARQQGHALRRLKIV
jgi:hypothetical protein